MLYGDSLAAGRSAQRRKGLGRASEEAPGGCSPRSSEGPSALVSGRHQPLHSDRAGLPCPAQLFVVRALQPLGFQADFSSSSSGFHPREHFLLEVFFPDHPHPIKLSAGSRCSSFSCSQHYSHCLSASPHQTLRSMREDGRERHGLLVHRHGPAWCQWQKLGMPSHHHLLKNILFVYF